MATKVSSVLEHKGHRIVTVAPHQTVASVARVLTQNRIGAAPVMDEENRLVGIISERDVIHGISEHGDAVMAMPVDQLMTREVMTCSPEDAIVEIMQVMTTERVRHLPVVQKGSLRGIISIGDVVKQRLEEAQLELDTLRGYILSS